jgi:hypothetical protein
MEEMRWDRIDRECLQRERASVRGFRRGFMMKIGK